jgi:hypothetical protein
MEDKSNGLYNHFVVYVQNKLEQSKRFVLTKQQGSFSRPFTHKDD